MPRVGRFGNSALNTGGYGAMFLAVSRRSDVQELAAANAQLRAELRQRRRELERLREENEILREAAEPFIRRVPARERFMVICSLRERFNVKRLCRILVTDRSNYYAWVRALEYRDERERDEHRFTELILEIHTAHPAYGVERISRELKRQGVRVGCRVVTRLMRTTGIAGITRRKRRNLTTPDTGAAAVCDLIQRDFTAPMPGLKLISDISCFPARRRLAIPRDRP